MKFLVAIVCVFVATAYGLDKELGKQLMQEMQHVGSQCVKEEHASTNDIRDLLAHKVPTSHEGQCLMFCFHKHYNFQNADGSLNVEGGKATIDRIKEDDADLHGKLTSVLNTCATKVTVDADPCVTAANMGTCAVEEGHKLGLSPEMFKF